MARGKKGLATTGLGQEANRGQTRCHNDNDGAYLCERGVHFRARQVRRQVRIHRSDLQPERKHGDRDRHGLPLVHGAKAVRFRSRAAMARHGPVSAAGDAIGRNRNKSPVETTNASSRPRRFCSK